MAARHKLLVVTIIIFCLFSLSQPVQAADNKLYFNGKDISDEVETIQQEGELLIKARQFAKLINAELKWQPAIKTLRLTGSNGEVVKLMVGSPYIQIRKNAIKSKTGLVLNEGHTFLPLAGVIEAFGYLIEFNREEKEVYVFKPETVIKEICWSEDGNSLEVIVDELPPYRIVKTDNPNKIILEIDKARVANEFTDNVSNNNFYLQVKNIADSALLRLIITSKYPIPFNRDGGISEEEDRLVLSFLPQITNIAWTKNDMLMIEANGNINKPEVLYLEDPRRMVIDIPSLMFNELDINLPDNEWVKDIRVSQFKYDPVTLRIVLEMKNNDILQEIPREAGDMIAFKPAKETVVDNLQYKNGQIRFDSTAELVPDLFLLEDPARLVINLFNAERGASFLEEIELDKQLVRKIRTARFDEQTIRIVADLAEMTGYGWREEKIEQGYRYLIELKNKFSAINLVESPDYQDINILLTGGVDYEIKKFSYPHRIVVDIEGAVDNTENLVLPEPKGLIQDIRTSRYELEGKELVRLVFELKEFNGYEVKTDPATKKINIHLPKEEKIALPKQGDIIVIDAGHGGFDPGAIGQNGLEEKDVNLEVALRVAQKLKEAGQKVVLTRSSDKFISLKQRVRLANSLPAKLFISIHANSFNNNISSGTETYYSDTNTNAAASKKIAQLIQEEMTEKVKLADRGIKEESFYVVKYTRMPAALLEIAFISNPHEEVLLGQSTFQEKVAAAVNEAILRYLQLEVAE